MLVIHPKDRTTAMLSALYEGTEASVFEEGFSNSDIKHTLNHVASNERIMLLGHGSDKGLFYRKDDMADGFDGLVISHPHAYYLRKHSGRIIAVWCHANIFAQAEGLHGLFTGMIVSEISEAAEYGIEVTQEELDGENVKFAQRLRQLFDEGTLLNDIPQRMLALDDAHTSLTELTTTTSIICRK